MMGYGHATMGAAAYLALTSTSALALSATPQDVPTMATGALLTAGAALLPDIDHHSATIAKTVPSARFLRWTLIASPTENVARAVERVSGGHRHMTHSLIGIAVATAAAIPLALLHLPASWVTWLLDLVGVHLHPNQVGGGAGTNLGVLMVSVFLAAVASKALGLNQVRGGDLMALIMRTWLGPWIIGLAAGVYASTFLNVTWLVLLPAIILLGTFIHCVGDSLTTQGVAWLQPWNRPAPEAVYRAARRPPEPAGASARALRAWAVHLGARAVATCWPRNGYLRIPVLGSAGSKREKVLDAALGLYGAWLLFHDVVVAWAPDLTPYII
jgi:putative membrane-bound metal-dependent hydrolase